MKWFWRLLTSRMAGPIAAAATAILIVATTWILIDRNATIRSLDRSINDPRTGLAVRIQQAQADLVQCRSNRLALEEATLRQNEAIEAASREGAARIADLDRAASLARQRAAVAQSRAVAILNRQGTGNACADADALILDETR